MSIPYTSWKQFYAALTEYLSTEFYMETYPELYAYLEAGGTDFQIITELLKTCDEQEGFDCLVETLLDNPRYAIEFLGDPLCVDNIFDLFPNAKRNLDILFLPRVYKDLIVGNFEDEVYNYEVRGRLIDIFIKNNTYDVKKWINWASVEATNWEYLVNPDYNNPIPEGTFNGMRYQYLKYCSDYLKSIV